MRKLFTLFAIAATAVGSAFAQTVASPFCETPVGHYVGQAGYDFATSDPASQIYLTVVNSGENQITITIKPHENNTKGINYLYVNGQEDGTAETGEAMEELSVTLTFNNGNTTQDFPIQWGNPGWGGRWQYNVSNFNINATCGECDLTAAPTVTSAKLVGTTSGSATFNVAGQDEQGDAISTWIVEIGGTQQEVVDMEGDGQISVSGLLPATEYTATILAKDRCGNISENGLDVPFTTEAVVTECSGNKGHFGNPDNLKVSYTFAYADGNLTITLTPYNSGDTFGDVVNVSISTMPGEQPMTISEDKKSATFTTAVEDGQTYGIYFLYSLSSMAGNEMTAENQGDSEHLIYYAAGQCSSSAVAENAAANTAMWPNPASKYVNVTSDEVIERIDVVAQNGAMVMVSTPGSESAVLDIAGLDAGRYIVIINTASGQNVETMLVK